LDMAARRRELDRVGDKVEQQLPRLALVGAQQRQARRQLDRVGKTAVADTRVDQLAHRTDRVAQIEDLLIELELAVLGLRQIENVVDDLQEIRAALVDIRDVSSV